MPGCDDGGRIIVPMRRPSERLRLHWLNVWETSSHVLSLAATANRIVGGPTRYSGSLAKAQGGHCTGQ